MAHIIIVLELPPSAVYRMRVSAESLYGTCNTFPFPAACYAKVYITLPNVCRDLLILLASLSLSLLSIIPVFDTLSLPARSTKLIKLDFLFIFNLLIHYFWTNSIIMIVCALELYSFISVEANDLFLDP